MDSATPAAPMKTSHRMRQADLEETTLRSWPFLKQLIEPGPKRVKTVIAWLTMSKVIGVLKEFKCEEIDPPKRYEALRKYLGSDDEMWDWRTADIVKEAVGWESTTTKPAQTEQKLIYMMKKLAEAAKVPGAGKYEPGSEGTNPLCLSAAWYLLLTVIKDLQHSQEPKTYWAVHLGGAQALTWESDTEKEWLYRPRRPIPAQTNSKKRKASAMEQTSPARSPTTTTPPIATISFVSDNRQRSKSPGLFVSRSPSHRYERGSERC